MREVNEHAQFYGSIYTAINRAVRGIVYADHPVMLSEAEEALQHNLQELNDKLE